ncbi:glycerophosphodiester phosphodiesterase [Orrella daihaiensis]|uniref:glycerophosphodiester phosphodiesterase n=1 Tax=Orrella daihaiensis TaxID=2782176 RepID=A0ABY4AHS7_9BURK|nr:glycerophosphodiester phosphodiesterase [Orrella daihaiensis]UOD49842.1 glycerophosphodiester phosphodiesterase [Orrella daihaiensis]
MSLKKPLIIAHRGASGYLPENTLAAKAVSHAQGADYWETDILASKDGELVVLHDLYLEGLSDVDTKFPDRSRDDGHFYVIDFTLEELRSLNLTERVASDSPGSVASYPGRFPPGKSRFQMHTLAEEIELLQGLNKSFKREVGLYLELKAPWFHEDAGFDLCAAALETLKQYGYAQRTDAVILETFDAKALQRIKRELMPEMQMDIRLGQLVGYNEWHTTCERDASGKWAPVDSDWMLTPEGLKKIASYADCVGVAIALLYASAQTAEGEEPAYAGTHTPVAAPWVAQAKQLGLTIHSYTLRADALPPFAADVDVMHDWLLNVAQVDGVFTDFPDLMAAYLKARD